MRAFRFLATLVLLAGLPADADAQLGSGRVSGTVRDERGRPLRGATVTAENEVYFPRSFSAATDQKGRFSLMGLRRAQYEITIRADGFETVSLKLPVVPGGGNPPLDVRLMPALAPAPPPLLGDVDPVKLQKDLDAAAALVDAGSLEAAIAAYRRIVQSAPALTAVHLQLGHLHEMRGDRAAAIDAYQAALEGDAGRDRAREALGRLRQQ